MKMSTIISNISKTLKANSPEILTAIGASGVVTTAYLAAKASYRASDLIRIEERYTGPAEDPKERFKERTKLVWRLYIPAGLSGTLSIACIVGANRSNSQKTAAAVTAYSLTEKAFSEYRDKVVEELGEGREQKLRDELVQERINKNTPSQVIIAGSGDVLCCELFTNRYFKSDMETLRKAQNDINARINNHIYVTLEEFYDLINLPYTSTSNRLGWDSDKLLELEFTTTLSENGEPCLAFDYNYTKTL